MDIYLIPEPVSMFLLGVGLVSLAWFSRRFFKKHGPTKTLLSDSVKKLRHRNGLKLNLENIQKKVEGLIFESKEMLPAKEKTDNLNRKRP